MSTPVHDESDGGRWSRPARRRLSRIAITTFVIAAGTRVVDLARSGLWSNPVRNEPSEEVILAQNLAGGRGFVTPFQSQDHPSESPSMHSPPLYPYLQAALLAIGRAVGVSQYVPYRTALILLIGLASASMGLMALGVAARFSPTAGWAAGIVGALWPPLVHNSILLWDTPLVIAFSGAATLLLIQSESIARSRSNWAPLIGSGAGIAALINPAMIPLWGVGILAIAVLKGGKHGTRFAAITGVSAMAVLAPWSVRNSISFGRPLLPIRGNFGLELWHGNRIGSDGTTQSTYRVLGFEAANREIIGRIGEEGYIAQRKREAVATIGQDWNRFRLLTKRRIVFFWFGPTLPKRIANAAFLALAAVGLLRLPKHAALGAAVSLLVLPIPYYVTHVDLTYRFRMPLEPLLVVGVALGAGVARTFVVKQLGRTHGQLGPRLT